VEKICARCSKTQRNHPELSFHAFSSNYPIQFFSWTPTEIKIEISIPQANGLAISDVKTSLPLTLFWMGKVLARGVLEMDSFTGHCRTTSQSSIQILLPCGMLISTLRIEGPKGDSICLP